MDSCAADADAEASFADVVAEDHFAHLRPVGPRSWRLAQERAPEGLEQAAVGTLVLQTMLMQRR